MRCLEQIRYLARGPRAAFYLSSFAIRPWQFSELHVRSDLDPSKITNGAWQYFAWGELGGGHVVDHDPASGHVRNCQLTSTPVGCMVSKTEFPPLLASGIVPHSMAELYAIAVDAFPRSKSRPMLWDSLSQFCEEFENHGLLPAKILIDGSFLTEKLDPQDIDLWVELETAKIECAEEPCQEFLNKICDHGFKDPPRNLDTYLVPSVARGDRDWDLYRFLRGQYETDFGTARSGQKKGIAEVEFKI